MVYGGGKQRAQINWPALAQQCAQQYEIPAADIPLYHVQAWLQSQQNPTENQKCYTKCLGETSGFLSAAGVHAEPYVDFSLRHHRTEPESRAVLSGCLNAVPSVHDCQSSWELYVCVQNLH